MGKHKARPRPRRTLPALKIAAPGRAAAARPMPCPRGQPPAVRARWRVYAPFLHKRGWLTPAERGPLLLLCGTLATLDRLRRIIGRARSARLARLAELLREYNQASTTAVDLLNSFGLTPAGRARIQLFEKGPPEGCPFFVDKK